MTTQDNSFDKIYKICLLLLAVIFISVLWMKNDGNKDQNRFQFNNQGTHVLDTHTGKTYEVR